MHINKLKYTSFLVLIFMAGALLTGCSSSKYAAKVNDGYITMEQYQYSVNEVTSYYETTARKLTAGEKTMLQKDILNQLISEELIKQAAKLKGISVGDKQVDDYINKIKKDINDDKKYQELLKDRAYNEQDYRNRLKMKWLTKALEDNVTKDISDPIAKKNAFDKYLADLKNNADIKIYVKFDK